MPAMRLRSVVFPEPFGPKTPTISPWAIAKETSATAVSPPKRLVRPSTSKNMAPPRKDAGDAAREGQDGQDEDETVDEDARLGRELDDVRQGREDEGTHDRPGHPIASAQKRHRDDGERLLDREIAGLDVAQIEGVERACDRGPGVADREGGELVAEDVDPERIGELVVEPD